MSDQEYLKALEDVVQLDGRRPSAILCHMQQFKANAGNHFSDTILKRYHFKLFPATIQLHLQAHLDLPIHQYVKHVDAIMNVYPQADPPQHVNTTITTSAFTAPTT
ncbi:hypothetical protein Pmani_001054 [Petrolisthes manimaculis]|uniref:Uncharacterized protein n=1 Tax=Petrolisthes manimaculis TaxID=1843537 RepID=A0AAE1UKQ0_9EUCA|nr:hypothetical protein Pmani_001054 [Petrolisthes manimaculis]